MITLHILEANLKVLPGKIILLHTEPLTHSLPLPPGQQRSHLLRRWGREGIFLTCPTQSVLSTAQGRASNLSGRDGFQGWQDWSALLGAAPEHTEHWPQAGTAALWGAQECSQCCSPRNPQQNPPGDPPAGSPVPFPVTVSNENCFGYCPPKSWQLRKLS